MSLILFRSLFSHRILPLALLAVIPTIATAETPSLFPDSALEAAVRTQVYEKRTSTDPLTKDDVRHVSRIIARNQGIKSLEGLQHCGVLMELDVEKNEISDLTPLTELLKLQSAILAGNKITSVEPLANVKSLQLLNLSDNQIADVTPLAKLENLRTLYIAGNQIDSLQSLQGLRSLRSLDASGNQLTDLKPIEGLERLGTLNVRDNAITSLEPIVGLKFLALLIVENNKITDLNPLVELCKQDAATDRRIVPFLKAHIEGNPIDEGMLEKSLQTLKSFGVRLPKKQPVLSENSSEN